MAERSAVSMQDIADELGVSKVTVSKALNDKDGVSDQLKAKIQETAAQMGYVLPDYGQRKTRRVAIVTNGHFDAGQMGRFYMSMYESITREMLFSSCAGVLITSSRESLKQDVEYIEKPGTFDGMILLGILDHQIWETLNQIPLPKVCVDVYDGSYRSDSIVTENIYAACDITRLLIRNGHREIGFVGTLGTTTSIDDRYLGFRRALMEQGLTLNQDWMVADRDSEGNAVDLVLPKILPTAFMCNCDESAFRLVRALRERGLRVPQDISVVGFDDDIFAELCEPQLTTVAVNTEEMGRMAVEDIVHCMTTPEVREGKVERIPGRLIIRDSVRDLRKKGEK
ncbi:MAG: LacI family DNA-binding transcriptional regulator [Lachnospiraceae bacterium]|nr:LacI family DNA-binding transcriptional regulator [Lachnospiraceae bacterium]